MIIYTLDFSQKHLVVQNTECFLWTPFPPVVYEQSETEVLLAEIFRIVGIKNELL